MSRLLLFLCSLVDKTLFTFVFKLSQIFPISVWLATMSGFFFYFSIAFHVTAWEKGEKTDLSFHSQQNIFLGMFQFSDPSIFGTGFAR